MSWVNKWCLLVLIFLIPIAVNASEAARKTVCLNMIVKNESTVITRCLESVLPMIDYWVICDTGSTDNTQNIIKEYMLAHNMPGELHERPWVNFGHNRNEALKLAHGKSDYILFIDADEYLVYESDFKMPSLDKDYYYLTLTWPGSSWVKVSLVNDKLDWEWIGVLHEVIAPGPDRTFATIEKVKNIYTVDGARSRDPKKYEKDAEVLENALKDEPNNSRYIFYLGKSYANCGQKQKAIDAYQRRADMGSDNDAEAFWAQMQVGLLQEELKASPDTIIQSYKKACAHCRTRAEPYYHLARYYRDCKDFQRGYQVAKIGLTIPKPRDTFFIEEWIYDYGMLMEVSVSSYWIGKYHDCQLASVALLQNKNLPEAYRQCAEQNLGFANEKLLEEVVSGDKK